MSKGRLQGGFTLSDPVCAVVVTYNRKQLLRECLSALRDQTRPVDEILVVNNASTDGTAQMLTQEFPGVQLLELPENVGGAGGFHEGIKWAQQRSCRWLWLMDDDGRPAPDCLGQLLGHAQLNTVLVPLQQSGAGELYGAFKWRGGWKRIRSGPYVNLTREVVSAGQPVNGDFLFTFVGALVPREVVEQVGLPNKDFFIYFDDIEFALRIRARKDLSVTVVPQAVFHHDFGAKGRPVRIFGKVRLRGTQPLWKMYYEVRNYLYTITRTTRSRPEIFKYFAFQSWLLANDLAFEPDRFRRVYTRLLGIWDGSFGRLGKRISP